jgi:regulatory protein
VARRSSREGANSRPPAGTALDSGIRYLAGRAHSRAELGRKLAQKGFEPDEVEAALGRLAELGYLDDAAFARALVRRRSGSRGPSALAAELSAKGISREGVSAALAGLDSSEQLAAATRLAERMYAERPVTGYREMLDRIGSKLLRRGYSGAIVREACRAVLAGAADRAGA